MVMPVVEFYKVDALPVRPAANAFYYIQRGGYVEAWLTSITGEPSPIGAIAVTQWGEIEGDIELQADLVALLAAKQDSASLGSAAFAAASSFATAAQGLLAENAQPKEAGKGLSEENYTLAEKDKLAGIEAEATKNRDDSENADKEHSHAIGDVTGLSAALLTKFDKDDIVGETGQSTEKVMSQKAVTDIVGGIDAVLDALNGEQP